MCKITKTTFILYKNKKIDKKSSKWTFKTLLKYMFMKMVRHTNLLFKGSINHFKNELTTKWPIWDLIILHVYNFICIYEKVYKKQKTIHNIFISQYILKTTKVIVVIFKIINKNENCYLLKFLNILPYG